MSALLELQDLRTRIVTAKGAITVVDGVSFALEEGECFGLVGESGSGKSMICRSILRLPPTKQALTAGSILFEGEDLLRMSDHSLSRICGRRIAMIVQDAIAALNPVMPVGRQIGEAMLEHGIVASRTEARERSIALMRKVGIPSPERRVDDYPHEFSGGMCQRVVIAAALACSPRVILADEPTTALDVTVQDQILKLLAELRREMRLAVVLVTHDMGVVAQQCGRVAVMYAGRFVEVADTQALFRQPLHPYTAGLMNCVPDIDDPAEDERLSPIGGGPPDIADPPQGCRFHPRCPMAVDACRSGDTPLREVEPGRFTACIRHEELMIADPWKLPAREAAAASRSAA
jgi:oligopeptide/dipeptide ABC transporter ATP-binding protein